MKSIKCGNPDCDTTLEANATYCIHCNWKKCSACGNWSWTYVCPKCGNRSPKIVKPRPKPKRKPIPKPPVFTKWSNPGARKREPMDPCCVWMIIAGIAFIVLPVLMIVADLVSYQFLSPEQKAEVDRATERREAEREKYGPEPSIGEVIVCLKGIVNDPGSLVVENAYDRLHTSHAEFGGTYCWRVKVDFKAKNLYGAYVRQSGVLYIKDCRLIGFEGIQ